MAQLTDAAIQLTAVCALSAVIELFFPEGTKKKGIRFLFGLLVVILIARAATALLQ